MEFEKIKELMNILDNSNLMDFELKLNDGLYLRMNKYKHSSQNMQLGNNNIDAKEDFKILDININKEIENISNTLPKEDEAKKEIKEGSIVKSPLVGTFYSSSSPTKSPYVKIGDKVKEGDVLCIIEAMKVMNEITSPYDGEVAEIFVKNEDMVEYDQNLFRIV